MAQSPVSVQPNRCSLLGLLYAKHTERDPETPTESRQFRGGEAEAKEQPWRGSPSPEGRAVGVWREGEQEEQGAVTAAEAGQAPELLPGRQRCCSMENDSCSCSLR